MEKLREKLVEILEVEDLNGSMRFTDFEEWDSLCILSILSMLDSDYDIQMRGAEIVSFPSVDAFCDYVVTNAKK